MYGVGFQNFPKPDAQQSVLAAGVYTTTTQLSAHMPTILSKNIRFVNQTVKKYRYCKERPFTIAPHNAEHESSHA